MKPMDKKVARAIQREHNCHYTSALTAVREAMATQGQRIAAKRTSGLPTHEAIKAVVLEDFAWD